ncbi:MAG: histidine kinase [Actinobacteria bacterium]|nr:histidine kinase [Actinomycetota bacterium]MCL6104449.1 histidine kinase [Actinomycetota bacterium]
MGLAWLFFLVYPLNALFSSHPDPERLMASLAGLVIFLACYLHNTGRDFGQSLGAGGEVRLVVMTVISIILTMSDGIVWATLFIFAAAFAGARTFQHGPHFVFVSATRVSAVSLLAGIASLVAGANILNAAGITVETALVGLAALGVSRLFSTICELNVARAQLAQSAITEERVRFGRDLHDLLGHSLSFIAIQSELIRKLLEMEEGVAARRAVMELEKIDKVARDALQEARETASNYRRPCLETELAAARLVLDAGRVNCNVTGFPLAYTLDPEFESVLAWGVRESATNVLRHARASTCEISIQSVTSIAGENGGSVVPVDGTQDRANGAGACKRWIVLSVSDNGRGPARLLHSPEQKEAIGQDRITERKAAHPHGSGLLGLSERAAALGGYLKTGSNDGVGYLFYMALPIDPSGEAELSGDDQQK